MVSGGKLYWLILAVLLWGLLHSLLASIKAKEIVRHGLGDQAMRLYRLGYNIFACISFLPVLALAAMTPDRRLYLVTLPWSALMIFGELLCVVMLITGFLKTDGWEFLGLRQAAGPLVTRDGRLVTKGLYRYVRHPLYSAGLGFIWLMPLMTVNTLAINLGLTVYVITGTIFEECKLRSTFGQAYMDYSARTPMFIPFTKWNKK